MKTATAFLLGALSTAGLAAAARAPSTYVDATYGFSIAAPSFPAAPKGGTCSPAIFFGPPEAEFAPNVNVLIQENALSLDAYAELNRKEMKELNLTSIDEKRVEVSGRPALRLEYAGKLGPRALHWLAVAVAARGRVYLVTATCPEEAWARHEKALRASLESFVLN
jgi:hypothetical protein